MRDANHATIERLFVAHGAGVVDTSGIGGGVPDMIVGFGGRNAWVEVKRPARVLRGKELKSTRCQTCGHDARKHMGARYGTDDDSMQRCNGRRMRCDCTQFVIDIGDGERMVRGAVSGRQQKWHREWPGGQTFVVEGEADVNNVIDWLAGVRVGTAGG